MKVLCELRILESLVVMGKFTLHVIYRVEFVVFHVTQRRKRWGNEKCING
jgi:hypothetical protein